jgi:hypothetical protein
MKQLNIDRGGLLWRLASVYGPMSERYVERNGTDICTYTRAILNGFIKFLLILGLSMFAALCVADFGAWVVAGLVESFVHPDIPAAIAAVAVAFLAILLGGAFIRVAWDELMDYRYQQRRKKQLENGMDPEEEPEPSFIVEAYRSFKDKYCVPMKFKD